MKRKYEIYHEDFNVLYQTTAELECIITSGCTLNGISIYVEDIHAAITEWCIRMKTKRGRKIL